MKTYYPTIGLEIHAELATKSKMFCGCSNDPFAAEPNTNVCPVCMGHPGTLPTANKEAVAHVVRVGMALDGTIATTTRFDRKHYFYPDIPKGYQISQYQHPIVSGGSLKGIAITRVHLEEDTGTLKHQREGGDGDYSLVDFNRAGVPLLELVTEPVIHSAKDAAAFARELQLLLRTLGASEANMERGEMRVEANISLSDQPDTKGVKVEVKNLNSFRSVERAVAFELARMEALYEEGREAEIVQETRGWDEVAGATYSQRSKESAHDYRYFPDPDLPEMELTTLFDLTALRQSLPELPEATRARYGSYAIKADDIEVLIGSPELLALFESLKTKDQLAANYLVSTVLGLLNIQAGAKMPSANSFDALMDMLRKGDLSSPAAREILSAIMAHDTDPHLLAQERGLIQEHDEALVGEVVRQVTQEQQKIVADYRSGKTAALQALIGVVMKKTKGSANPKIVEKILREMLG